MRREPLLAFLAVLAIGAIVAVAYLAKPREVISSTPSSYTGLTAPLPLPANATACADEITFDTDSEVARFGASAVGANAGPDLEVTARGNTSGPYRNDYRATAHVPGGWTGTRQFDVPLQPPRTAVFGSFCVRNLSDKPVNLVGSEDGRAFSRPSVTVDGDPSAVELQLTLLQAHHRSVLARLGQVTTRAATLKPLGAWWIWLLGLALLVLAPLGMAATLRAGLAEEDVAAPAPALVWPAWTRRLTRIPGWAILLVACALAVLWLLSWSVETHVFQNDEDQYVYLSRWLLGNFPHGLWDFATYGRGLQRLEVWLIALPTWIVHDPYSLGTAKLLNVAAFVSTAIPVYLLARGNGLSQRWAALPAGLSAVVPWAVVTTAFLTENLAYPAFAWIVYGVWRATLKPGLRSDLLAVVLIFIGGLSRSALLALAPVLPLTIVITGLRCGSGSLVDRGRTILREHVYLWGAIVALALLLVVGVGPFGGLFTRVAGGYGTHFAFNVWDLVEKSARFFARIVIGTGFLPAAIGLPWLALTLVRSREPAAFALAATAVISALVIFYTLNTAGFDERYIVYLAPLVLLPAGIALARREISPVGTMIASALLALLLVRVPWNGNQGSFAYFVWPVETFYTHVFGFKLAKLLPGGEADALKVASVVLGLIGIALGAALRWSPRRVTPVVAGVLVGAVAVGIVADTQYSLSKHVNGVGSKAGPSLSARSFVDTGVPGGQKIGEWATGVGADPGFYGVWREVQFYNQRLDTVVALGGDEVIVPPGDFFFNGVAIDDATGRVKSPLAIPPYMVVPTQADGPHLRGRILQAPTYIPVALMKLAQPVSVAWAGSGFGPDGAVADAKKGAQVSVYPGDGECVSLDLVALPDQQSDFAVQAGTVHKEGQLAAGSSYSLPLRLPELANGRVDIQLFGDAHLLNVRTGTRC